MRRRSRTRNASAGSDETLELPLRLFANLEGRRQSSASRLYGESTPSTKYYVMNKDGMPRDLVPDHDGSRVNLSLTQSVLMGSDRLSETALEARGPLREVLEKYHNSLNTSGYFSLEKYITSAT
jgi:hypothetical protein